MEAIRQKMDLEDERQNLKNLLEARKRAALVKATVNGVERMISIESYYILRKDPKIDVELLSTGIDLPEDPYSKKEECEEC